MKMIIPLVISRNSSDDKCGEDCMFLNKEDSVCSLFKETLTESIVEHGRFVACESCDDVGH